MVAGIGFALNFFFSSASSSSIFYFIIYCTFCSLIVIFCRLNKLNSFVFVISEILFGLSFLRFFINCCIDLTFFNFLSRFCYSVSSSELEFPISSYNSIILWVFCSPLIDRSSNVSSKSMYFGASLQNLFKTSSKVKYWLLVELQSRVAVFMFGFNSSVSKSYSVKNAVFTNESQYFGHLLKICFIISNMLEDNKK
jgi:hypothetical protein